MTKNKNKKYPMLKWAKDLFPLCRSLTGNGTAQTLRYFKKINIKFKIIQFKSGKKVFDWAIPKVWNIRNAYLEHESKKKYAEFKKCNLHVVGYSYPINKKISKKELIKNIFTQKNQPNSIPYVTSYYKKKWGFCMSEKQKQKLPSGMYRVLIDSDLKNGSMEIMHANLKGRKKNEIFFSSYVCHPSMANNELSGPVLLNALMKYIEEFYPKPNYTYRFVLHPETIGSIAYLSKFKNILQKNVICGFNLSCVGDSRAYSLIHSPSGNNLADQALKSSLIGKKNVKHYSFLDRGSDERQYCSPKINLPFCGFSRSKNYPEYHTNKDDFKVVTEKGLQGSFEVMKSIIDAFETSAFPKNKIYCEPNLGKRNLYPTTSQKGNYLSKAGKNITEEINLRSNLIAYADGKRSIFEISNLLNLNLEKVCSEYKILKENKIF